MPIPIIIPALKRIGPNLTEEQRQILRRMHSLKKELNETMDVLILCTTQSDLEGIIESHKILLDHMNKEVPKLIVECVDKFS